MPRRPSRRPRAMVHLALPVAALLLVPPAARLQAQARPASGTAPASAARPTLAQVLTGTWELDAARSEFGPMPRPSAMTRRLQVSRETLDMAIAQTTPQGEVSGTFRCAIGGATCRNVQGPSRTTGSARWERGSLIVVTTLSRLIGPDLTTIDRYLVSDDGGTLTVERTFEAGGVASASKGRLVFRRRG
ncbi:MAG: hypothetical protein ACXW0Z_12260 [Gemmatirosa sp.]